MHSSLLYGFIIIYSTSSGWTYIYLHTSKQCTDYVAVNNPTHLWFYTHAGIAARKILEVELLDRWVYAFVVLIVSICLPSKLYQFHIPTNYVRKFTHILPNSVFIKLIFVSLIGEKKSYFFVVLNCIPSLFWVRCIFSLFMNHLYCLYCKQFVHIFCP